MVELENEERVGERVFDEDGDMLAHAVDDKEDNEVEVPGVFETDEVDLGEGVVDRDIVSLGEKDSQ